jgi:hypothetical protein
LEEALAPISPPISTAEVPAAGCGDYHAVRGSRSSPGRTGERVRLTTNAGGVPERSNGAVLKTVGPSRGPWVRIPAPPPETSQNARIAGISLGLPFSPSFRLSTLESACVRHRLSHNLSHKGPSPLAEARGHGASWCSPLRGASVASGRGHPYLAPRRASAWNPLGPQGHLCGTTGPEPAEARWSVAVAQGLRRREQPPSRSPVPGSHRRGPQPRPRCQEIGARNGRG